MQGVEGAILDRFDPNKAGAKVPALLDDFRANAGAVSDTAEKDLTRKLMELGRGGDTAESVGYRAVTAPKSESIRHSDQRRRKDDDLRFALRTAREQLDARLAEIEARRAEIAKRLGEIEIEFDALDELERLQAKGVSIDPTNPAHAAMLRRAGIPPEKIKPGDDIALLLLTRRLGLADERDALHREDKALEAEGKTITAVRDDMEANPDDPAVLARLAALGRTDSGARVLGGVAQSTTREDVKLAAADAVALSDASKAATRESVTDTDAALSAKDDLGWDAPTAPKPR